MNYWVIRGDPGPNDFASFMNKVATTHGTQ